MHEYSLVLGGDLALGLIVTSECVSFVTFVKAVCFYSRGRKGLSRPEGAFKNMYQLDVSLLGVIKPFVIKKNLVLGLQNLILFSRC